MESSLAPISVSELNCELEPSQLPSSLVESSFVMNASELGAQLMKLGCWGVCSVLTGELSCSSSCFVMTRCYSGWSCHC